MLHLLHSQRLEVLADALARRPALSPDNPLVPEPVLTPNHGVTDWLRLHLTRQWGICANIQFQLPTAWLLHLAQRLGGGGAVATPEQLTWQLYTLVRQQAVTLELPLTWQHGTARQCWLLAAQLARCYADYAGYRPEWLVQWVHDPPHWQGRLWQALHRQFPATCLPGQRLGELLTRLRNPSLRQRVDLPARLTLFGFTHLAPLELALVTALAERMDVWLYGWMPCQEYWGDVRTAPQLARQVNRPDFAAQHYTEGHRLLAAWGGQARVWLELLLEQGHDPESAYLQPPAMTLLEHLQTDMLTLRPADEPQAWHPETDRSIQIHGAHGPRRELEILHDQLLHLLRQNPDLGPGDIAILVPDLERYAPYIEAVFGQVPANRHIPYSLADRQVQTRQSLSQILLRLLTELPGRWLLNQVLDYLELPALARRFGLPPDVLPQVHHWLEHAHVRWGSDAAHRAALGLPATDEHSFRIAVRRLLLGYALPEQGACYAGLVPEPAVEGTDTLILGKLAHYLETLFQLDVTALAARLLSAWSDYLLTLTAQLFQPETDAEWEDYAALRTACLALTAFAADCPLPVEREVVVQALQMALDQAAVVPFLQGRVNFCALTPARALPFAIIGVLGLNQGEFPRTHHPSELDLLLTAPARLGDALRGRDDRALMLQILHAARRHLYLSYVSRDVRDDTPRPPSVLLDELRETLAAGYTPPLAVCQHPLQAFAPVYFQPDTPQEQRSYAQEWVAASDHTRQPKPASPVFCPDRLPPDAAPAAVLDLAELTRFWEHPLRYWVRHRLQVQLLTLDEAVPDSEPFTLTPLDESRLWHDLSQREPLPCCAQDWQQRLDWLRAQSRLPHGTPGTVIWQRLAAEFHHLQQQMRHTFGLPLAPENFSLTLAGLRLQGQLTHCHTHGLGHQSWARPRARYRLRLWLEHLIWQQLAGERPRTSHWLGKPGSAFSFRPIPVMQAQEWLAQLIAGYQQGQDQPLYFFPETAYAYQVGLNTGAKDGEKKAREAWYGTEQKPAEREDPYLRLVLGAAPEYYRHRTDWLPWAATVYQPLLEHQADGDLDAD